MRVNAISIVSVVNAAARNKINALCGFVVPQSD
jgi:hypothetical protein